MDKDKYLEKLSLLINEQRKSNLENINVIDQVIENLLSLDKGVDLIRTMHHDISLDEIFNHLATHDLFYFSLLEDFPEGIDPLIHEYYVDIGGFVFRTGHKSSKRGKFHKSLDLFIYNLLNSVQREQEDFIKEGESVFRLFYNHYLGDLHMKELTCKMQNQDLEMPQNVNLIEITTNSKLSLDFLLHMSDYFDNSNDVVFLRDGILMFTEAGVVYLEGNLEDHKFIPYSSRTIKKVRSFLNRSDSIQVRKNFGIREKLKRDVYNFRSQIMKKVESSVNHKVQALNLEDLSSVEKKAKELFKKYGSVVKYKERVNSRKSEIRFCPPFTFSELELVDKILDLIKNLSGLYIDSVFKYNASKEFDGTVKKAYNMINQRFSKLYSSAFVAPENAHLYNNNNNNNNNNNQVTSSYDYLKPEICLSFTPEELLALKHNFSKYFPIKLAYLAKNIFYSLTPEQKKNYIGVVEPEIKQNFKYIKAYGLNVEDNITELATIDFMKCAAKYQLAKISKREPKLNPQRITYFENLFRLRLEHKN
tara:strand:- start:7945 stop:9543 length:1599 start_codon:yes stop_codon:yes gene_type:complete